MQCVNCATAVPDDARYCQSCGSLVSDAEGQARASASIDASGLQHMENLLREDTAGQFEIRGPLGRGGMAMVYLATETALNRKVAIKVLPPELTFGHGVERFKREAKTAAALDHPNIIPVYRVATGGKLFWYAMKFLEGRSLDDTLKEKSRLPLKETVAILEQVADALDYAHEHKVVHRDVKPANVMLDSRNRVVVTDFGIAKALTEGTLTASGSVIGTPFFMSPEQGMGKAVSGASDQYSVAVMAYRMLSGHVPFDGDSAIDILHKHCMVPAPPLDVIANHLPPYVGWAVSKALEKDPAKRFPTVRAFVEAMKHPTPEAELSTAATVMSAPAVRPGAPPPGSAKTRGPRPSMQSKSTQLMDSADIVSPKTETKGAGKVIAIVVGLALVAGTGGWYAMQQGLIGGAQSATPPSTAPRPQTSALAPAQQPTPAPQPAAPAQVVDSTPARPAAPPPAPRNTQPQRPAQRPAPPPAPAPVPQPVAAAPTRGVLQIAVSGSWAVILVDGVAKGEKTRHIDTLAPGPHAVRLERDGYGPIDTTVTISAGGVTRLQLTMVPRP